MVIARRYDEAILNHGGTEARRGTEGIAAKARRTELRRSNLIEPHVASGESEGTTVAQRHGGAQSELPQRRGERSCDEAISLNHMLHPVRVKEPRWHRGTEEHGGNGCKGAKARRTSKISTDFLHKKKDCRVLFNILNILKNL
jgi:hypothetical protein